MHHHIDGEIFSFGKCSVYKTDQHIFLYYIWFFISKKNSSVISKKILEHNILLKSPEAGKATLQQKHEIKTTNMDDKDIKAESEHPINQLSVLSLLWVCTSIFAHCLVCVNKMFDDYTGN
jgi:hypothetical protein